MIWRRAPVAWWRTGARVACGRQGPNMVCEACDLPVASRIDDCSLWQAVWLAPDAVRRLPVADAVLVVVFSSLSPLRPVGEP